MPNRMLHSPLLAFAAAALCWGVPVAANPGAQEAYVNAMNLDIAATPPQDTYQDNPDQQEPPSGHYDPLKSSITFMLGMAQLQAHTEAELAELAKDPRYQNYQNGGWEHFSRRADAEPGEYCTSVFWSKDGFIILSGPGGDYEGAMLMFAGTEVPAPDKMKMIKATLAQTSADPVTLNAFNFQKALDTPGVGTIAFAVPSAEALMGGMEEQNDFVVSLKGRKIFSHGWRDGIAARDAWGKCISQRQPKP